MRRHLLLTLAPPALPRVRSPYFTSIYLDALRSGVFDFRGWSGTIPSGTWQLGDVKAREILHVVT